MANAFSFKEVTTKTMKITGMVDTDTGEDITKEVIDAIPSGIETVDFKLTFELPDEDVE